LSAVAPQRTARAANVSLFLNSAIAESR